MRSGGGGDHFDPEVAVRVRRGTLRSRAWVEEAEEEKEAAGQLT